MGLSLGLSLLTILLCFTLKLFVKQPRRRHRSLFFFPFLFSFPFLFLSFFSFLFSVSLFILSFFFFLFLFLFPILSLVQFIVLFFLFGENVSKHILYMLSREFQYVSRKSTQLLGRLQSNSNWSFSLFNSFQGLTIMEVSSFDSLQCKLVCWALLSFLVVLSFCLSLFFLSYLFIFSFSLFNFLRWQ